MSIVVKPGQTYEWTVRLNSMESGDIFIGIIEDTTSNMNKTINNLLYPSNGSDVIYRGDKGYMYRPSNSEYPKKTFKQAGDILKMKIDLNSLQISFNINNEDFGNVPNVTLRSTNYRFALSAWGNGCELEFI